jgi:hypothetical protein
MINLVQLQNDLLYALLSSEGLQNVNILQFRKMRIESEIDWSLVFLGQRAGRGGVGVIVEMPEASVDKPNIEGPMFELDLSFLVVENPTINLDATTGSGVSAEDVAQNILDLFHLWNIEGVGQLRAAGKVISDSNEFEGCVCYRVTLRLMNPRGQTQRCAFPVFTATGSVWEITCSTESADIWFTTDETFPGRDVNSTARQYSGPFDCASGTVLRAVAYKDGMNMSAVKKITT